MGWSTVKNATESDTLYLPGTSHNSVQIKGDTTLYAQWGNIFATITYNDLENYGELEPTYIPYTENISVSMLKHPGPGAQIFQGWRVLSKNYSADIDFNCYSLSSDSDQSLKFNSYNLAPIGTPRPRAIIIYNTDGGTAVSSQIRNYDDFNGIILTKEKPEKDSVHFYRWKFETDGKVTYYYPGSRFHYGLDSMLTAEYTESPLISFDTGTDNDDELPAYDPPEPQIYTGNQFVLTNEVPERPGYEFIGWKYGNDSTLFSRGSSNFRLPAGETVATLVAQWRKQTQMTHKYVNPNGSIVQSLSRIVKYGEPYANNYINNINGMPQVEDID